MKELIKKIEILKKEKISEVISDRIKEFEKTGKAKQEEVFSELCFCLLTANFQADKCIRIQKEMGRGFEILPEDKIAEKLKEMGHRFWEQRADRIVRARSCSLELRKQIFKKSGSEMRSWLVKNVFGLGMKEASHFLRNVGYKDVAIVDFHIVDLLVREGLIERFRSLTPKRYLEVENILSELGRKVGLDLAELDLYLWYIETGKVLK